MIRQPAVAGLFYPADEKSLSDKINSFKKYTHEARFDPIALIAPHAGYKFSGEVANIVFSASKLTENFILIGPNHRKKYPKAAIYHQGSWNIPGASLKINEKAADQLTQYSDLFTKDNNSHKDEHALETILPFIEKYAPSKNLSILPIILGDISKNEIIEIATAITELIRQSTKKIMIVISSDFSHYIPEQLARKKDLMLINKMKNLDYEQMLETVKSEKISACGYKGLAIAMIVAKNLGGKEAILLEYRTSAQVSNDYSSVVGYAGILIV